MENNQLSGRIRNAATELDTALVERDRGKVLSFFVDDCEIEPLGITLKSKESASRWLDWFYEYLEEIKFTPRTILVKDSTFFKEFVLEGTTSIGSRVTSKQAEGLTYEGGKLKSLRLYFDWLDFAETVSSGPIGKWLVKLLIKNSLKGLVRGGANGRYVPNQIPDVLPVQSYQYIIEFWKAKTLSKH